jgi:hypothetical protein
LNELLEIVRLRKDNAGLKRQLQISVLHQTPEGPAAHRAIRPACAGDISLRAPPLPADGGTNHQKRHSILGNHKSGQGFESFPPRSVFMW